MQLSSPQNVSDISDAQNGVQYVNRTVNSPRCASLGQLNVEAAFAKFMHRQRFGYAVDIWDGDVFTGEIWQAALENGHEARGNGR